MSDRLLALPNWKFAMLPATQLMACVIGVQLVFGALLCSDSPYPALHSAAIFVWWLLAYLVLLALIPVALAAQQLLLGRGALSCNWI